MQKFRGPSENRRFKVENISSLSKKTALVASVSTHDTTPFIAMMFDGATSMKTMQSWTRNHSNSRIPVSSPSDR